jgi:hypothetical protein
MKIIGGTTVRTTKKMRKISGNDNSWQKNIGEIRIKSVPLWSGGDLRTGLGVPQSCSVGRSKMHRR